MNYPAYPTYKESGVPWLGDVPEHWGVTGLRYVARFDYGDSLSAETREKGNIPVYGSNGSVGTHVVSNTKAPVIVVGRKGSYGKINYSDTPIFAIDTTYFVDQKCTKNKLSWLKYSLLTLRLDEASKDSAVPGLGREDAYNRRIPVPPLSEQTAIADFLDRETGRIDTLIEKKRRLIVLLREKRSALISRTVTRGLPAEAAREFNLEPHTRFKDSGIEWLGEVPEGWEVKRLSYLALLKSGESITSEQIAEGGQCPVYGGNGMRGYFSDYTHEGLFVLIGRQGALCGNINYASGRFWASEHAVVVNPLKRFAVKWLGELLRVMNLNQYSISAAQPGLSLSQIGALKIPVPPYQEQTVIANYLDRETAKIDKLTGKVEQAIERLQEYRTALITAAVTGKIDVRYAVDSAGPLGLAAEEAETYG